MTHSIKYRDGERTKGYAVLLFSKHLGTIISYRGGSRGKGGGDRTKGGHRSHIVSMHYD